MKVNAVCKQYFSGFSEIRNCRHQRKRDNALAIVKIVSYFTGLVPLGMGVLYLISLRGRVRKKEELSPVEQRVDSQRESLPIPEVLPVVDLPVASKKAEKLREEINNPAREEVKKTLEKYIKQLEFSVGLLDFVIPIEEAIKNKTFIISPQETEDFWQITRMEEELAELLKLFGPCENILPQLVLNPTHDFTELLAEQSRIVDVGYAVRELYQYWSTLAARFQQICSLPWGDLINAEVKAKLEHCIATCKKENLIQ